MSTNDPNLKEICQMYKPEYLTKLNNYVEKLCKQRELYTGDVN